MASKFDTFTYGGHGVAESTLMEATFSGAHFYNVVNSDADMDNGSVTVIDPTKWVEEDYFTVAPPAVGDKIALVLTAPKIYAEYTERMQEEDNFYNGTGEIARAYEVKATDRFALNKEAFADGAEPAKDKYVFVDGTGLKLTVGEKPDMTTYGFVGYILHETTNGKYVVFVIKNEQVYAAAATQAD